MRILIIDDSKANLKLAQDDLQGHELTLVSSYDEGQAALTSDKKFDALLTDLMLPASKQALGPKGLHHAGEEMPLGAFLMLLAMKAGVKKVGLVTDTNHHNHPASAALDVFHHRHPTAVIMGDTSVVCYNKGKDWGKVLEVLNGGTFW